MSQTAINWCPGSSTLSYPVHGYSLQARRRVWANFQLHSYSKEVKNYKTKPLTAATMLPSDTEQVKLRDCHICTWF